MSRPDLACIGRTLTSQLIPTLFFDSLHFSHHTLLATTTRTLHQSRDRGLHSPGGVHAFLRVQHIGRRMLFIRFVNRAVQAVWRSHHEDGSRQEIADIPRFAAPPGDAHRARGSLMVAPSRHAGCNTSAKLLRPRSNYCAGFKRNLCVTLAPNPAWKSV